MKTSALAVLMGVAAVVVIGCDGDARGAGHHEEHADEHTDEVEAEHEGGGPALVRLSAQAQQRAGIVVGTVQKRSLRGGVGIPAEVLFDPSSTAHVGPLVPGRITGVSVALGDRVKRGQLLGTVASTDVSAARAGLDQARAQLSAAESTLTRQRQLSAEGIGAERSLIEAEARVGELSAAVEGLRRQLSVFGSGRAGELALTAPMAGIVVGLHGTLGETASPDRPVFIVTDPSKVWVRGNVPELEIERVRAGDAVIVRLHAFAELALPGTITYVAPAIDEQTRSLPVRVALATPDPRLRSGLYGSIELLGGEADARVPVVPVDAVATLEGQSVVFVPEPEPHTFRVEPVVLGRRATGFFELLRGPEEGTSVAVSGAFTLKSVLLARELTAEHHH